MSGLGKLVRMLSSPSYGDSLNAVRMLGRALQKAGRDWHWLAGLVDGEEPAPLQRQHDHEDIEDHQVAAGWLLDDHAKRLREKDRGFLDTMINWRGRPTERQQAWLDDLCRRFGYRP